MGKFLEHWFYVFVSLLAYGALCGAIGYFWGKAISTRAKAEAKSLINAAEKRVGMGGFVNVEMLFVFCIYVASLGMVAAAASTTGWNVLYWLLYLTGSASHAWSRAWVVVRNPTVPAIGSYPAYVKRYAPVLWTRFLWGTAIFVAVVFGGYALDAIAPGFLTAGNKVMKCAVSLLLGLAVDSMLDKVCAKYEWAKDAVPAAPTGATSYGQDLSGAGKSGS